MLRPPRLPSLNGRESALSGYLRELQAFAQQNQVVSAPGYLLSVHPTGTTLNPAFPPTARGGGSSVQRMIIIEIQSDWFNCLPYDQDGQHPDSATFNALSDDEQEALFLKVAKPWELRFSPWDGQTIDGLVFSYADDTYDYARRRATIEGGGTSEIQIVVRPWYVGEIILAVSKIKGGTDQQDDGPAGDGVDPADLVWEDLNTAAHAWAQTDQSDPIDASL